MGISPTKFDHALRRLSGLLGAFDTGFSLHDPTKRRASCTASKSAAWSSFSLASAAAVFSFSSIASYPGGFWYMNASCCLSRRRVRSAAQGLTLVHFSAQRKRFCGIGVAFMGCFGGCAGDVMGYEGLFKVYSVSETAQLELKSGRG